MVWGIILPCGKLFVKRLVGNQKSSDYKNLMSSYAVPLIRESMGNNFILQQDNCTIHVSKEMKDFFQKENIKLLQWPANSPDLNIFENIWKVMSDKMYDGFQFKNAHELEERVKDINVNKLTLISDFYDSIQRRICDVMKARNALISNQLLSFNCSCTNKFIHSVSQLFSILCIPL